MLLVDEKGKGTPPRQWPEPAHYFYRENQAEFSASAQPDGNAWHDGKASGIRLYDIGPIADTAEFSMGNAIASLSPKVPPAKAAGLPGSGSMRYFDLSGASIAYPSAGRIGSHLSAIGRDGRSILF